jgi:hypothetical protein
LRVIGKDLLAGRVNNANGGMSRRCEEAFGKLGGVFVDTFAYASLDWLRTLKNGPACTYPR